LIGSSTRSGDYLAISHGVLRVASFLSPKCGEAAVMLAFFYGSR